MKNKIRIEFDKIPKAFLVATHEVVQKKLFELGYKWVKDGAKVGNCYDFLWAYDSHLTFSDYRHDEYPPNSAKEVFVMPGGFDKMVEYLSEKEFREEIKLNDDYNAIVTPDGVTVGCQSFTFEAIEGLYASVQRAKKEKSKVDYFVTQDPMEIYPNLAWAVKGGLVYSAEYDISGKIYTQSEPSQMLWLETIQKDIASGKRIKMTEEEFIARAKAWLSR